MPVLKPKEYDISYFDGKKTTYSHNAGYAEYKRWKRFGNDFVPTEESTGEYFRDLALRLKNDYSLANKKVLELGCAKGFVVEDLREMGVDAYGIDVSQYAIDQASPAVKPYLTVADARTHLSTYKNKEFDVVFSRWFLSCIDDADLPNLIKEMNRISKLQVHIVREEMPPEFYNAKLGKEWLNFDWAKGTIIIPNRNMQQVLRK